MTNTIPYDFDTPFQRRGTGSAKWGMYPEDVLPMWVADMDFQVAPAITAALQEVVEHACYGYTRPAPDLKAVIAARMKARYDWDVTEDEILFVPGVVPGINLTAQAVCGDGAMLIQTPVYFPFHSTAEWSNVVKQMAPLAYTETQSIS